MYYYDEYVTIPQRHIWRKKRKYDITNYMNNEKWRIVMKQLQIGISNLSLPVTIKDVAVPPIKCQGIKTKLVPFIFSNVRWHGQGRWIEPFMGSGVVGFNLASEKALFADNNVHIVRFYKDIQVGNITPINLKEYLQHEGTKLNEIGEEHYYKIRDRFNNNPNSLDFIFLSRACFNGMMRFNSKGEFNVPFCRKPDRFRQAYITKIVNQVRWVESIIRDDWSFEAMDWRETLAQAQEGDFVYCDPPYIGRHTDYYNTWGSKEDEELIEALLNLPCGWALSNWKENKYRKNPLIEKLENMKDRVVIRTFEHFYHVGAKESNRNEMTEALIIRKGYEVE